MTTSSLGSLWHVGIVVENLDEAMTELSAVHQHRWTSVQEQRVVVDVGGQEQSSQVRWAASRGEEPDWEIIQAAEGLWSCARNGGPGLHHIAYWSDDLDRDVALLESQGYEVEARGTDTDGQLRFAYLLSRSGVRIELGARYTQAAWDEWVGGGDYGLEIA